MVFTSLVVGITLPLLLVLLFLVMVTTLSGSVFYFACYLVFLCLVVNFTFPGSEDYCVWQ